MTVVCSRPIRGMSISGTVDIFQNIDVRLLLDRTKQLNNCRERVCLDYFKVYHDTYLIYSSRLA